MLSPKRMLSVATVLFVLALYTLIWGQGGLLRLWELQDELELVLEDNAAIADKNAKMNAELASLREGVGAVEERARHDLNMVRPGEVLFRIQRPQKTLPGTEIPADIINDPMFAAPKNLPPEGVKPLL